MTHPVPYPILGHVVYHSLTISCVECETLLPGGDKDTVREHLREFPTHTVGMAERLTTNYISAYPHG
jgi:hypothetical protein